MKITRTANAGVLLELDGGSILLDGVCREVKPYPATPPEVKTELERNFPDVVAFTHAHKDHYDPDFAATYLKQTSGVILGSRDCRGIEKTLTVGGVLITPLSSRHIGIAGRDIIHYSFLIEGSKRILFTGDAAPTQWHQLNIQKPDIIIVPYAYATTSAAWITTQKFGAESIVLVHMPDREDDDIGLWDAVENTTGFAKNLYISNLLF